MAAPAGRDPPELACNLCSSPGTKKCSRCGVVAYCSADCQRKDWPSHKLSCAKVATPESEVQALIKEGRLYTAQQRLALLPTLNARLTAEWENQVSVGLYSEIVDSRMRLEELPDGAGMGYIAAVDLEEGATLLFDTAFLSVRVNGAKADDKEWHFRLAEKAVQKGSSPKRRTDPIADQQGDFYHDRVMELCTKHPNQREWFDTDGIDKSMLPQLVMCSIAEANGYFCNTGNGVGFVALFVAAARLNHSCRPNASLEANRQNALVRATAPIQAGEEVRISYLTPELLAQPAAARRAELKEVRGFDCACHRCREEMPQMTGGDADGEEGPADGEGPAGGEDSANFVRLADIH